MPVYEINGLVPVVDPSSFVHPTATLIGDVIIGPNCYIAPGASMRGDAPPIWGGEEAAAGEERGFGVRVDRCARPSRRVIGAATFSTSVPVVVQSTLPIFEEGDSPCRWGAQRFGGALKRIHFELGERPDLSLSLSHADLAVKTVPLPPLTKRKGRTENRSLAGVTSACLPWGRGTV